MKSKNLKISILTILVSLICSLAWGFICLEKEKQTVYAAGATEQECYLMIKQDGINTYTANAPVGLISGGGQFVVGHEDVELSATAKENFQLIGWKITYSEQSNKTEFVDLTGLVDNKKTITLTAKDSSTISAEVDILFDGDYAKSSTFALEKVFENMVVTPVFDHIYYNVEINDLVKVSPYSKTKILAEEKIYQSSDEDLDGKPDVTRFRKDVLFHTNEDAAATTYLNSYLKTSELIYYNDVLYAETDVNYYFYDKLESEGNFYYTTQQTLEETPTAEKIDYKRGCFRLGDEVKIALNVKIDATDIINSTNIDLKGISVLADETKKLDIYDSSNPRDEFYKTQKDSWNRTTSYEINFNVAESDSYQNVVKLDYHKLYVVDLKILVDGSDSHSETADIFGTIHNEENQLTSNISLYNFYAKTKADNSQFLIKSAQDNGARSFGVVCAQSINKVVDGNNYRYYIFNKLNSLSKNTQYFGEISQNIEVVVDYSSVLYNINFQSFECVVDPQNGASLHPLNGNTLDTISLKRGSVVELTTTTVEDVVNTGYKFVGYALTEDSEIVSSLDVAIDNAKPTEKLILLCYQKIEYKIVLTNYNKVNVGSLTPIKSIAFTLTNADVSLVTTLTSANLVGQSVQLSNNLILNGSLQISTQINNGFELLGYSLVSTDSVTADDYIEGFTLTTEFIEENNLSETITIYVYEAIKTYSLTYTIQLGFDDELDANVIMANINATSDGATIEKYDNEDKLISETNGNLTALVKKIVVSNLKINDVVKLTSEARTAGVAPNTYEYMFNYFTEVEENGSFGKIMLSHSNSGKVYSHDETIIRDREITVVYTMPSTKILVRIDEEFALNEAFEYSYSIEVDGSEPEIDEGIENSYIVGVGKVATITIESLAYGYAFDGYALAGVAGVTNVSGMSFNYTAISGINTVILKFSRIKYRFVFTQYGAELNGVQYDDGFKFNDEEGTENDYYYTELDVDNSVLTLTKPLGYYVSTVKFAGGVDKYSSDLSENNNAKFNSDITKYSFNLTRDQFIDLIKNYSQTDKNITKVLVRLDYLMFTYQVKVTYKLTNPKNDSRDTFVKYPTIGLNYTADGHTYTANKSINDLTLTFIDIPYGAFTRLVVSSGAPTGLTISGWRYSNDDVVLQEDYKHSSNYLEIGSISADKEFLYKLTYNAYEVNVVYDSTQGDPSVYINNNLIVVESKQITLYDSLKIEANPIRENGYKFKAYVYNKPVYTIFDGDNWGEIYDTLYIKVGDNYEINTSPTRQDGVDYYTYSEEEITIFENIFEDESFNVLNYVLDNKKITITLEYELLQLTIVNNISEKGEDPMQKNIWKLSNRGSGDSKIQIAYEEMVSFDISATNKQGVSRPITESDTVTFNDVVTVIAKINKNAKNFDGTVYDLTLGLIIKNDSVQIAGEILNVENLGNGEYKIQFDVGSYIPADTEIININYVLTIQKKTINVTTAVTNSTEFYKNITFNVNAYVYSFDKSAIVSTNNATKLEHGLQFLAKTRAYSTLSDNYAKNFKIGGADIYCDGLKINPIDYSAYGISFDDDWTVYARMAYDINVVFKVQPIITYNGGPNYSRVFKCTNQGEGVEQSLTVGSTSSFDIQIAPILSGCITIKYLSSNLNAVETETVTNCGSYKVIITFNNGAGYDWLEDVEVAENVTLTITPQDLYLNYEYASVVKIDKIYDGSSEFLIDNVYQYLLFKDVSGALQINYLTLLASGRSNLILNSADAFISTSGSEGRVETANETVWRNVYIYNLSLKDTEFNRNFNLKNSDLIISNYIRIMRRRLDISGLNVYDKVYDGTDMAEIITTEDIKISNLIPNDDLTLNYGNLNVRFEDAEVGANKKVIINAAGALLGDDVNNYYIDEVEVSGLTIYPYSISTNIDGVGEIKLINKRGLTEKDKVALIPMNAAFKVEPIYVDSSRYVSIYKNISKLIKGNNEYAIGYELVMLVGGEEVAISNDLYLVAPNVKNMTGAYFLTGSQAGKMGYSVENGLIVIDLKEFENDVDKVFFTQKKILLKAWQIALIVILLVLVITAIVLVFVIIRKRKKATYSVNEKI